MGSSFAAIGVADPAVVDDQLSQRTVEQRVLDGLLPDEMDWEEVVRTYPLTSIAVAGIAGFLVGSRSGRAILTAVADSAVHRVTGLVDELVDR